MHNENAIYRRLMLFMLLHCDGNSLYDTVWTDYVSWDEGMNIFRLNGLMQNMSSAWDMGLGVYYFPENCTEHKNVINIMERGMGIFKSDVAALKNAGVIIYKTLDESIIDEMYFGSDNKDKEINIASFWKNADYIPEWLTTVIKNKEVRSKLIRYYITQYAYYNILEKQGRNRLRRLILLLKQIIQSKSIDRNFELTMERYKFEFGGAEHDMVRDKKIIEKLQIVSQISRRHNPPVHLFAIKSYDDDGSLLDLSKSTK